MDTYKVIYRYIDGDYLHVDNILNYTIEAGTCFAAERIAYDLLAEDVRRLYGEFRSDRIWRVTVRKMR